jgi:hypothetical protein
MPLDSMSHANKIVFLARAAYALTVCARETYEVGTDNVLQPQLLRAYNELLHRIAGALQSHVLGTKGYSIEAVIEIMHAFGARNDKASTIAWVMKRIERDSLS